jgi:flagellar motor switch protein FliG
MFVFEDLQRIDQNGIRELVARVERKNLAMALKGTSEALRNHFFQSMSKRGAEMFQEDMEALGPVKIRDVEGAQQKVIAQVRQMETEGIVSMKSDGEQAYVV